MSENGEMENGRAAIETNEDVLRKNLGVSERFQQDTRNYLQTHLLSQYESIAQATIYNILQNILDNRAPAKPLEVSFAFDTQAKTFEVNMVGTTGITDWTRFNALNFEGAQGSKRRGEGAKVLVPLSRVVRTETRLLDGEYRQVVWMGENIFRSERPEHDRVLKPLYPPTALAPGSTRIVAEGFVDEVGKRFAGLELADRRIVERVFQQDWFLLLEDPTIHIVYEIDGDRFPFKALPGMDLVDEQTLTDVPVLDAQRKEVGKFERIVLRLAKAPLRGPIMPGVAVCTDFHTVAVYAPAGPNGNRLYGYATAPFLAASEATDHFHFNSTHDWRAAKETLLRHVAHFLEKHAGMERKEDPRTRRVMAEVTAQINRLIRDRFADWHPEGGWTETRERPDKEHDDPWISHPTVSQSQFQPGDHGTVSFDVVGPDRGTTKRKVQARVIIAGAKSRLHSPEPWPMEIDKREKRAINDAFEIPADAPIDIYCARFSVVDEKGRVVSDRRVYFKVGEPAERPKRPRTIKEKQPGENGQVALKDAQTGEFPKEEDDTLRESYYFADPPDGPMVALNMLAPQYRAVEDVDAAWRYHIARCQIDELAALRFDRELNVQFADQLTPDALSSLYRRIALERSTFLASWAQEELARLMAKTEPRGAVVTPRSSG